jgi:tetratricopeptide (TPR) repeat protein
VQGTILTAVCQKENGRWQTTTLQDFGQCVGDIWNVDGYLNCDIEDTPIDPHDPDLDQKRFFTHLNRAEVYEQGGNYQKAIDEYKRALSVSNSIQASCGRLWLAHAYAAAGQRAAAEKILKQATRSTQPNSPAYCVAQAFAAIDTTESLRWLERANQERDPRIPFLATDWRLFSLRSTPRFQELARAVHPAH